MAGLERFVAAQDQPHGGFADALAEIEAGRKRGHWIWYVFPQLRGLGGSTMSTFYGLEGPAEAEAYLRHPVLRERLAAIAAAAARHLAGGSRITEVMGSDVDALKLVSSMTLFERVAAAAAAGGDEAVRRIAATASSILQVAEGQGYPRCARTLEQLGAAR
jgi:uncharacterized protein (DUF1810 family)